MSQLTFDFDKRQSVANATWGTYVCTYCGRDWGNQAMFDINCNWLPYWQMCGSEFWIARRAGKL